METSSSPPPSFDHLIGLLEVQAAAIPDLIAYDYLGRERLTYRQLREESFALARSLMRHGFRPHAHAILILPLSTRQILLVYAALASGAALVLLDPDAPANLLLRRIQQARASHVITTAPIRSALRVEGLSEIPILTPDEIQTDPADASSLPEVTPEHTAYLQFTSGTTGEPKVVVIRQRQLMAYLDSHARMQRTAQRDIFLSWLPLFHDMGLVGTIFLSLYTGGECHLLPPHIFSLGQWLQTATRVRATVTSGPDFAYRMVTRTVDPASVELSSVRMTGSGGEPLRIETIRKFEERFGLRHTSVGGYGLAESVMCISMGLPGTPPRVDEHGNVANGRPLPGLEVRIVDGSDNPMPAGQSGEIVMRGPTIFAGYLDDPAASAQAVRGGWLHTGDVGYLDGDGYLFVLGRSKSLIKRGGVTISPREVECAADRVAGVRFSVAVGVPRRTALHSEDLVVLAEARPESAATPELQRALSDAIASAVYAHTGQTPSDVVLLRPRAVPRTANGKIQHLVLRDWYAEGKLAAMNLLIQP